MDARFTGIKTREVRAAIGGVDETAVTTVLPTLTAAMTPRVTYHLFDINDPVLRTTFLVGRDVPTLLEDCHRVILLAATLGAGVDTAINRLQITDMAAAVMLDACADGAIENVCDNLCTDLAAKYGYLTHRFSPGYGDYPFALQRDFAAVLDLPRTIGVTLTDSGLMVPQKSVTALVGIAATPPPKQTTKCAACTMRDTCTRKERAACEQP